MYIVSKTLYIYSESADLVFVNETWLTNSISYSELLHEGYTIFRKDRTDRRGGGVLIAAKSSLFRSVKNIPSTTTTNLELISAEFETFSGQKILLTSLYRPDHDDETWQASFNHFLDETCSKYNFMLICRDMNFPKILWDPTQHLSGASEKAFVDSLDDHFLTKHNSTPTRGNKILDLVISSVPEQVGVTDVVLPIDAEMFTDHSIFFLS